MKKHLAIALGKSISKVVRGLNLGGGSAAPGLYALKIYPNLIEELISDIPKNVMITGTNGKTTTARMLSHFAKTCGLKVIRNATGSNLERGIASALIHHPISNQLGVWEVDEAAFNSLAPKIKPDIIIFLNVLRDQLDRYGEVDSVVKGWCETLKGLQSKTKIIVNGDDPNTSKLSECFKGKVLKFGLSEHKIAGEGSKISPQKLDIEAVDIKIHGLSGSSFKLPTSNFKIQLPTSSVHLPIPGFYNIYNFLASFLAGMILGLGPSRMVSGLKDYSPAFGRVEKFNFGYMFLIKNPAGATEVFKTISPNLKRKDRILFALNDNLADGKDVSWIWDSEFEKLKVQSPPAGRAGEKLKVICSGKRAQDLAVRLKYAGFEPGNIVVKESLKHSLEEAKKGLLGLPAGRQGRLFILPTYTAMLEIQKILAQQAIKEHYWKSD